MRFRFIYFVSSGGAGAGAGALGTAVDADVGYEDGAVEWCEEPEGDVCPDAASFVHSESCLAMSLSSSISISKASFRSRSALEYSFIILNAIPLL